MSGDARDGAWSIHVGTVLARPPPFSQRGHTFAWCEATNRTVLPVCIPYNQLSDDRRGPTGAGKRVRTPERATRLGPGLIPALVGNISCKTVKQNEISDHAELLN